MKSVFEKIVERLEEKSHWTKSTFDEDGYCNDDSEEVIYLHNAIEIVNQAAKEYGDGWISVKDRLPDVETEVLILTRKKYTGGNFKDIITTAMYEDGTVSEHDSIWRWEDIEGEWDEENDCYIIPEGWWENRHYNPDEVYNNVVDDEVIAWQPLPEPYKPKEATRWKQHTISRFEKVE